MLNLVMLDQERYPAVRRKEAISRLAVELEPLSKLAHAYDEIGYHICLRRRVHSIRHAFY
jgi:hypothetical protein